MIDEDEIKSQLEAMQRSIDLLFEKVGVLMEIDLKTKKDNENIFKS